MNKDNIKLTGVCIILLVVYMLMLCNPLWANIAQRCEEHQFRTTCYDKKGCDTFHYDKKRTVTYPNTKRKYLSPREQFILKKLIQEEVQ
jgi:hypothetical protein